MPFRMADILNRHGMPTYYLSLSREVAGHNSTRFHYGAEHPRWDLTDRFGQARTSRKETVRLLRELSGETDLAGCLATGSKSYLLKEAGIPYHYWSYGSDLDTYCFSRVLFLHDPLWSAIQRFRPQLTIRREHRRSIRLAESVMIASYQESALRRVSRRKKLFFLPHLLPSQGYPQLQQAKAEKKRLICERIGAEHFFFSSARHFWGGARTRLTDNKGNDLLLRIFSRFLETHSRLRVKLLLVEKGPDVEASMRLAGELGISAAVNWLDEMPRGELLAYYQGATVCLGQFGTPVLTYSSLEPLSQASPCVSFYGSMRPGFPFYGEPPPICNTTDIDTAAAFLDLMVGNDTERERIALASWEWIGKHCSEESFSNAFQGSIRNKREPAS